MKKKENKKKYGYIKIEIPDYPEIKKVYCQDCAYYQEQRFIHASERGESYIQSEACLSEEVPDKTYIIDTYKCRMPITKLPHKINYDNNCIYFKRKWKVEKENQEDSN